MDEIRCSLCISQICRTVTELMGFDAPEAAAPANYVILDAADRFFGGERVERALLYNPDEKLEEIDEIRPGESELRVFASQTYGVTTVDFKASGGFLIERHNAKDGQIEHTIEETSPAVFPT